MEKAKTINFLIFTEKIKFCACDYTSSSQERLKKGFIPFLLLQMVQSQC